MTAAADLERTILLGLAAEWDAAAAGLTRRHRGALRRPLLALADTGSRLGCWDRAHGEIRLSRAFVLASPWDETRDLLRHEMAHQLADQAFGAAADTAHGPAFREACRLLGAHPGASGRFVPLGHRLDGGGGPERARAVERVRKLLALAASRNRHEAELALLRARELASRHRLDAGGDEGFVSAFAGEPALRHARDAYRLAGLVTRFWGVYGIWVPAWVLGRGRMGTVLELSGAPPRVKLARYAHDFVRRQAADAWAAYSRGRKPGARSRGDFLCGVIEGFGGTLERGGMEADREGPRALVRTGQDPAFERYLAGRYPRRSTIRRGGGRIDAGAHREGVRAGEGIVVREGIEAGMRGRVPLLPG